MAIRSGFYSKRLTGCRDDSPYLSYIVSLVATSLLKYYIYRSWAQTNQIKIFKILVEKFKHAGYSLNY